METGFQLAKKIKQELENSPFDIDNGGFNAKIKEDLYTDIKIQDRDKTINLGKISVSKNKVSLHSQEDLRKTEATYFIEQLENLEVCVNCGDKISEEKATTVYTQVEGADALAAGQPHCPECEEKVTQ